MPERIANRRTRGHGDPSGQYIRRMRSIRTSGADRRRFVRAVAGFGMLFGAIGVTCGEQIGLQLQETPTTTLGWLFIGWLIGGPPYLVTILCWHDRDRFRPRQRRNLAYGLGAWIGLSMFVLPARVNGVDEHFGTAALVGDPLSVGWAWGTLANLVGFAFAALVLTVLHRSVPGRPSPEQLDMTIRFLERAWGLVLLVSLGFALYGQDSGIFQSGT